MPTPNALDPLLPGTRRTVVLGFIVTSFAIVVLTYGFYSRLFEVHNTLVEPWIAQCMGWIGIGTGNGLIALGSRGHRVSSALWVIFSVGFLGLALSFVIGGFL